MIAESNQKTEWWKKQAWYYHDLWLATSHERDMLKASLAEIRSIVREHF